MNSRIKQTVRLMVLLFTIGLFSECSYIANFYIFNQSKSDIEIEYQINQDQSQLVYVNPIIVKARDPKRVGELISELKLQDWTLNCTLKPNEGLRLGKDVNFTLSNPQEAESLNNTFKFLRVIKNNSVIIDTENSKISDFFETIKFHTVAVVVN